MPLSENHKSNPNLSDDAQIVEEILSGNKKLFTLIEKKYSKIIANLIRKMIKDEDDVDDLVQVTFIKIYKSLDKYQSNYSFSSWIYKIASNTCIDFLRKKRLNIMSIDQFSYTNDDDENSVGYEIADRDYQPDIEYINKEKHNTLLEIIENLPDKYRTIIKLRHIEEMEYKAIADELNMPLGTVKIHLFRARKLLLDELKKANINVG